MVTSRHLPRFHFNSDGVRLSEAIFEIDWAEFVDIVMVHRAQRRILLLCVSFSPSLSLSFAPNLDGGETFWRLIKSQFLAYLSLPRSLLRLLLLRLLLLRLLLLRLRLLSLSLSLSLSLISCLVFLWVCAVRFPPFQVYFFFFFLPNLCGKLVRLPFVFYPRFRKLDLNYPLVLQIEKQWLHLLFLIKLIDNRGVVARLHKFWLYKCSHCDIVSINLRYWLWKLYIDAITYRLDNITPQRKENNSL